MNVRNRNIYAILFTRLSVSLVLFPFLALRSPTTVIPKIYGLIFCFIRCDSVEIWPQWTICTRAHQADADYKFFPWTQHFTHSAYNRTIHATHGASGLPFATEPNARHSENERDGGGGGGLKNQLPTRTKRIYNKWHTFCRYTRCGLDKFKFSRKMRCTRLHHLVDE